MLGKRSVQPNGYTFDFRNHRLENRYLIKAAAPKSSTMTSNIQTTIIIHMPSIIMPSPCIMPCQPITPALLSTG
jgi:hypothetical protein